MEHVGQKKSEKTLTFGEVVVALGVLACVSIVAVGVASMRRSAGAVPPCYDLADGGRVCLSAPPIEPEAFFRPPARKGPVVWCNANSAGLVACDR